MLHVNIFTFNPVQENTYLLYNEQKECCIIDPGCYFSQEKDELKDFIVKKGLRPKYLLNTHGHFDHVFGNQFVHEQWKLEPYIHPQDQEMQELAHVAAMRWNLPFDHYKGPWHLIREGEHIMMGEDRLDVIFAPGHAPGHICFYCKAQEFVIGGDVLFRNSIGRTDLPGGDHAQLLKSIQEQLFVLPDNVKVYPGHGEPTTIGYEKGHNPFLQPTP